MGYSRLLKWRVRECPLAWLPYRVGVPEKTHAISIVPSQSSDQTHNELHLRSPEGQGPAHISTAYWPTLPSRSFLLSVLERPLL